VGGIVAGIASNVALTLIRMAILLIWYLILLLILGPWHPSFARTTPAELWVPLKLFAYPIMGERTLESGFDGPVVLLGVGGRLVFAVCSGALFGLIAHRLGRIETVAVGILFGIACWALSAHVITPPIIESFGRLIEFIPYGLILAVTYIWYQGTYALPPCG
jgi:hypothetical protein